LQAASYFGLDFSTKRRILVGMTPKPRIYSAILSDHIARRRQMALVCGPRQVGKTFTCRGLASAYLDWDNADDRRVILAGPGAVAERLGLQRLTASPVAAVFDELHKHRGWKRFLKGFFDTYEDRVRILVTGSSRLDEYRRGGDSLMGRYFLFHMHPLGVAELVRPQAPPSPVSPPEPIPEAEFRALLEHGGYPEPFLTRDPAFTLRWRSLRRDQLLREDARDLANIQDIPRLEVLAGMLAERSGSQLVYGNLAPMIGASADTVRRWVDALALLQHGFLLRPWFRNVSRSLRKEPKWYLRDWSGIPDPGARAETLVACHLLKAVDGWNDLGLGRFELRYLRDKEKREVDFAVIREGKPWFLAEVKVADAPLSPALAHFQAQTGAAHAFQVVLDLAYEAADCFSRSEPVIVPARTFLSQLI
jgi:hypothetical protein